MDTHTQTDRHTYRQTHDDSIYRTSIASHSNKIDSSTSFLTV